MAKYQGNEEELKRKSGLAIEFLGKTDRETHIKWQTILDFFKENKRYKTEDTKINYIKWATHFFEFTGVIYINDITEQSVRDYETQYLDPTREENDYSYKWKNDRAHAIKKILSFYAEKNPTNSIKVKEIRLFLMIWDRTKDRKPLNPYCITQPISKI